MKLLMEKLNMKTGNVVDNNVAKIAALFPQCVTERIGKSGKPEYAIDFDKLRAELSNEVLSEGEERYQFTWPDKRAASHKANERTTMTLRPYREESVDFDTTENLYIEGDNLDVLKVLRETYLGKVKMIYIDPPYNTGNDFVYNDNFNVDTANEESRNGLFDESGMQTLSQFERNTASNGRFHTDWLNMIYPRLKIARDLLSHNGIMFISISDNEVFNLKKMCDEIFGADNFLGNIIWNSTKSVTNTALISVSHTYTLIFCRNIRYFVTNRFEFRLPDGGEGFENPDNDLRGPWKADPFQVGGWRPNQQYSIINPKTKEVFKPNPGCSWKNDYKKFQELLADNRIVFGKTGEGGPQRKRFIWEAQERGKVAKTIWDDVETTTNGTQLVKQLFNGISIFDNPKPIGFITRLLQLGSNQDSIILDFFSGSATTAHAVMKLNAEDGGHRKFIMVQLPEVTDEKSEARKAGYKNICEIGKERIRRAGKKIMEELERRDVPPARCNAVGKSNNDRGLFDDDSTNTSNSTRTLDIGFRVLKLDSSNMEDVYYTPENFSEKDLFNSVDNVKPDRTPLDLLFQVMPELNIELSAKIEEKEVNGKKVFFVDDNYLIATFDTDVNESTVTEIAKMKPQYFVMRDASAANDNVLDNFEQIFRHYSPDTTCKVL
ncbi:MAG: site-specific DNA-methyltransferase [Muribaculum sp.]|nr:site-specific DNA-methyltransferase [Muribaculum sp.]